MLDLNVPLTTESVIAMTKKKKKESPNAARGFTLEAWSDSGVSMSPLSPNTTELNVEKTHTEREREPAAANQQSCSHLVFSRMPCRAAANLRPHPR